MWSDWFVVAFLVVALAVIGTASFIVRRSASYVLTGRYRRTATGRVRR